MTEIQILLVEHTQQIYQSTTNGAKYASQEHIKRLFYIYLKKKQTNVLKKPKSNLKFQLILPMHVEERCTKWTETGQTQGEDTRTWPVVQ